MTILSYYLCGVFHSILWYGIGETGFRTIKALQIHPPNEHIGADNEVNDSLIFDPTFCSFVYLLVFLVCLLFCCNMCFLILGCAKISVTQIIFFLSVLEWPKSLVTVWYWYLSVMIYIYIQLLKSIGAPILIFSWSINSHKVRHLTSSS